ncbi:hypothetical protein [Paenibacillus sp. B-A-8]|uniref:hypothetical protein n=1 Tax=Paenibacillus sp. B-A-8 TaxID=3400419 RepID=UPI003B01CAFA
MSDVLITKFPVTAPDGTEFRVKIEDVYDGGDIRVLLHVKRKRFGFRKITGYWYDRRKLDDITEEGVVDYVALVQRFMSEYYAGLAYGAARDQLRIDKDARKQAAVERFNAWDGRIE